MFWLQNSPDERLNVPILQIGVSTEKALATTNIPKMTTAMLCLNLKITSIRSLTTSVDG